jgi:diguanylate cyclase (GGDEF)-like protein
MSEFSKSGKPTALETRQGAVPTVELSDFDRQNAAAEAPQRLRTRRLLMAAASSLLIPVILLIAAALDLAEYSVAGWSAVLVLALSTVFYAFFRSGLNLRFRDPSMSAEITLSAILSVALISYWAADARHAIEMFYVMALIFAALRLRAKRLLGLAAAALVAHGAMLLLWHRNNPGADVADSVVDFAALAIVLPWFAAMGGYVNALRLRLSDSNRRLTDALARIESIAVHDELTGLFNRRFLLEVLEKEAASLKRTGRPFAICLLDIDHFKSVNDTYGHGAGDTVLKYFAKVAGTGKRGADVFGRLGGEEFLLVMPDTGLAGALACAERVRGAVEAAVFPEVPAGRRITVTGGIALASSGEAVTALLGRADEALYGGKAAGRNCIVTAA